MNKKKNNGDELQPFIPKGNGEHSGEYTYSSFSGQEYINTFKEKNIKYKNIGLQLIAHISDYDKEVENVINILEEANIPNIELFLDNFSTFDEFQYLSKKYKLTKCKTVDDLYDYISKFYSKYPLKDLEYCLYLLNNAINDKINDSYYHHYYGCKKLKGTYSTSECCRIANPNYEKGESYQLNCLNCVIAMEMLLRGYSVEAKPYNYTYDDSRISKLYDVFSYDLFITSKSNISNKAINSIYDGFKSSDNSRFILTYTYMNENGILNGHALLVEAKKGDFILYNPQKGEEIDKDFYKNQNIVEYKYARIDNLPIKPKSAKKYCQERKD